jgi:hypothetical protein
MLLSTFARNVAQPLVTNNTLCFFRTFQYVTFSEHRDGMKQKKLANKLHFLSRMHEEVVVLNPNVTGPLL